MSVVFGPQNLRVQHFFWDKGQDLLAWTPFTHRTSLRENLCEGASGYVNNSSV